MYKRNQINMGKPYQIKSSSPKIVAVEEPELKKTEDPEKKADEILARAKKRPASSFRKPSWRLSAC